MGGAGSFFKHFTLGAIENPDVGENIVRERVAVGLGLQLVSGPALAFDSTTVKFLEAVYQPRLLLFEHLNVSAEVS